LPPPEPGYQAPDVQLDGSTRLPTAHVLDLDAMARRALADEMPFIMLRMGVRLAGRAAAQYALQKQMAQSRRDDSGLGPALALLALQIGGAVLESADERGWRSLPAQVTVARGRLPRGEHKVDIRTDAGTAQFDVALNAAHAIVCVRLFRGRAYLTPIGAPGQSTPATPGLQTTDATPVHAPGSAATDPIAAASGPVPAATLYAETRVIAFPTPAPGADLSSDWRPAP
nr:hypothetical protein [Burkholderiales bacterium]